VAEFDAFTRVWGVIPGGGPITPRSNTLAQLAPLGSTVVATDANTVNWVCKFKYVLFGEALVKNNTLMVKDQTTSGWDAAAEQFTVMKAISSAAASPCIVCGVIEGAGTSGYYGWVKTNGYALISQNASDTVTANITQMVGPLSGSTAGTSLTLTAAMTITPFATAIKTATAATAYVNLHCNQWA
jgi:hypothetical protein